MSCPVCHTQLYPAGSFTPQVIGLRLTVEVRPTNTVDGVLTVREHARMRRVNEMLTAGVNPYTELQTMVIGGKAPRADMTEPGFTPPMDKSLWQPSGKRYDTNAPIWKDLAIPLTPVTVEGCSFCGVPVNDRTLTRGVGKPRKILKTEQIVVGERVEIVERVIHIPKRVVACPDCSLEITPVYARCGFCKSHTDTEVASCRFCHGTREGERLLSGIKFRETPG